MVITPPSKHEVPADVQLPAGLSRVAELLEATEGASRWTEDTLRSYVPVTVLAHKEAATTEWIGEIRRVSVFFLLLKTSALASPTRESLQLLQRIYRFIQETLYGFEAVIKEFTVDDKGCVIVAGFGMIPYIHADDAARAVRASQIVVRFVESLGAIARIGISTGTSFCAWIGCDKWRDFAMVGNTVNMSARLMANKKNKGILVCDSTFTRARGVSGLQFETLEPIFVKVSARRRGRRHRPGRHRCRWSLAGPAPAHVRLPAAL